MLAFHVLEIDLQRINFTYGSIASGAAEFAFMHYIEFFLCKFIRNEMLFWHNFGSHEPEKSD